MCQVLLKPKEPPKSITLVLVCYPSFFTSYHHRQGKREVITPAAKVAQDEDARLPGAQHWWALYQDAVFDVARGEGEGPCGLVVVPAQVDTIRFHPQEYPVISEVYYKPDQRDLRLLFADFPGLTNAQAYEYLSKQAAGALATLVTTDFRPLLVTRTDLAAERQELERLIAKTGRREEGDKLRGLLAKAQEAWAAAQEGAWQAEKTFGQLLQQYRDSLWDLKIAALFAD